MVVARTPLRHGQHRHRGHHLQHVVVPPDGDQARRHVRHEPVVHKAVEQPEESVVVQNSLPAY